MDRDTAMPASGEAEIKASEAVLDQLIAQDAGAPEPAQIPIQAPKKKHGGARPGAGKKPRKTSAGQGDQSSAAGLATAAGDGAESTPAPPVDIKPNIAYAVQMPFLMLSKKTGCALLALEASELAALTEQIDRVLSHYCPNISSSPETMAGMLALGIAGLAYTKYTIYQDWKASQAPKEPTPEQAKQEAPGFSFQPATA